MEQIGKLIGKRKYEALKALALDDPDENSMMALQLQFPNLTVAEALKLISSYETNYSHITTEIKQSVSEYFDKINEPEKPKEIQIMTKEWLWLRFNTSFKLNEGVKYSKTEEAIENIKPLIYYFIGDFEKFKACENVSSISEPSMSKGLMIIGGYGNGKTSVMRALYESLKFTNVRFTSRTANDVVTHFESCGNEFDKREFWKYFVHGDFYFDDILTEREASNYGKVNLFKDIFEKRYDNKSRTYITCNHKDENEILAESMEQFGEKYGSRVYDRIFSMFNIIQFKGKTFRK